MTDVDLESETPGIFDGDVLGIVMETSVKSCLGTDRACEGNTLLLSSKDFDGDLFGLIGRDPKSNAVGHFDYNMQGFF